MRHLKKSFSSLLLLATFVLPLATAGYADRRGHYRYYDPETNRYYDRYYHDYHIWTPAEQAYYNRYYAETHRPYRDVRKLSREQQKEYWHWRHEQAEHSEHVAKHHEHELERH